MFLSSGARPWRAAISTISAAQDASRMPDSGADTQVLRIEHVRAHDLDLDGLVVNRRGADQPLPQSLAAARNPRETHPAIARDRRGRGGHVAKSRRARLRFDGLYGVSPTPPAPEATDADVL